MAPSTDQQDIKVTVNLTLIAAILSALALLTSVLTAVEVFQEDNFESRLACLELPGPNDCGLDGK